MARKQKKTVWMRRVLFLSVFILVALGGLYYYLANYQDLAPTQVEKYPSSRDGDTISHSFKITAWNLFYYDVDVYLALPNIWHDQGIEFSKDVSEITVKPFQKKEIVVTLSVPADLIESSEMKVDLVKSIEREPKEPIIKSLLLPISALAD